MKRTVVALMLLMSTGCWSASQDDEPSPDATVDGGTSGADVMLDASDADTGASSTPPPETGALIHTGSKDCSTSQTRCRLTPTINTGVALQARVLDANDQPVRDAVVTYELVEGSERVSFADAATRATTGEDGVATVNLQTGQMTGTARVRAYTGNEALGEIVWDLEIVAKEQTGYQVNVTYEGEAEIEEAEVRLFPASNSCDELVSDFSQRREPDFDRSQLPESPFPPRRHSLSRSAPQKYEGQFTFNESVERGKRYTVWATGYKATPTGSDEKDVELTYGCTRADTIEGFELTEIDLQMEAHAPLLRQEYTIHNRFDLAGRQPKSLEQTTRLLGLLIQSPGSFLVGCKPGDKGVDGRELCPTGSVDGMFDLVVARVPGNNALTDPIKKLLADFSNGTLQRNSFRRLVDEFVINKRVNSNQYANAAPQISREIRDSLTRFQTKGAIGFDERPRAMNIDGKRVVKIPAGGGEQEWSDIRFFWRDKQGCSAASNLKSCYTPWLSLGTLLPPGKRAIKGALANGAVLSDGRDLHIEEHQITLDFAALTIATVEHVVLPRHFSAAANGGQAPVTDFDADGNGQVELEEVVRGTIADCKGIAKKVDDSQGGLHTRVDNACDALVGALTGRLEQILETTLRIESQTSTFSSPDGRPCAVHQPETYPSQGWEVEPLPYIDRLGENMKDKRCSWSLSFGFANTKMEATFHAE